MKQIIVSVFFTKNAPYGAEVEDLLQKNLRWLVQTTANGVCDFNLLIVYISLV